MATQYSQAWKNTKAQAAGGNFTGKKPSLFLYLGVGFLALLKDLLDLVFIGSLPGIGTIITLCFTGLIWMLLTLFDHSGGKGNKQVARGIVIILFGLVEAIGFGLNFLPIETLIVVVLYQMAKSAWKKEEKAYKVQQKKNTRAERIALAQERVALQEQAAAEAQAQSNDEVYNQESRKKVV